MPENPLEVVQNLILDTIEPFIDRIADMQGEIEALKAQVARGTAVTAADATETAQNTEAKVETPATGSTALDSRVEAVLALHRLDAVPQQWIFRAGKREQAPEGMWEVSCAVCKDHRVDWQQGDPEPPRCKTVQLLVR